MPSKPFDVFLSHNSRNKPEVRELYHALKARGLKPWLDEEELRPGQPWQPALEKALNDCQAVAVLIGSDGFSKWHEEETQAALTIASSQQIQVIPVRLPSCPPEGDIPLFLRTRSWVDLSPQLDEHNLQCLIWGITGKKTTPSADLAAPTPTSTHGQSNPFQLTPASGSRFVGRDKYCRRFLQALQQGSSISLVGDTRMGKTSLLMHWQSLAEQAGHPVRRISGEGRAGGSYVAFVADIIGQDDAAWSAEEAANALTDWLATAPPGKTPVVLVDEADRALRELPTRFFERLRGMVTAGQLCLVLASRRDIHDIECQDHKTSPLANCLNRQQLGLLDADEVAYICAGGQLMLGAEGEALLRQWAGRHPGFLAPLAHSLWQARQEGEALEAGLSEFKASARFWLHTWWIALPPREQEWLTYVLNGAPLPPASMLNERGLLDHGQPFGQVLTWWWEQRG